MRKGTVRGIIVKDNKVAVIKRIKEKEGKIRTYYVLPGGGVEEGETNEEAICRELKEELEIDCKVISYVGEIIDHREGYDIHVTAYRLEWLSVDIKLNDQSEYCFVPAAQLYDYHFEEADKPILDILNQRANKGC